MPNAPDLPATDAREFRVPAGILDTLAGVSGAPALEAAGRQTGTWLAGALREVLGVETLADAPSHAFWSALDETLRSRGWGTVRAERLHSGVAVLVAEDWVEGHASPGCPFTRGLLSALFTEVAGRTVAVVETACAAAAGDGPGACRFAFGSDEAMEAVARALELGQSEEAVLATL
jgi:predicted hydrocarbon binding protein